MHAEAEPPGIGRAVGVVAQLAAALVVTAVLLVFAEWTAGHFVPPAPGGMFGPGDDFVQNTLNGLDLAPDVNP